MFEWCGMSVAPCSAYDQAKEAAAEVSTLSNDEDFIVDALARHCGVV